MSVSELSCDLMEDTPRSLAYFQAKPTCPLALAHENPRSLMSGIKKVIANLAQDYVAYLEI